MAKENVRERELANAACQTPRDQLRRRLHGMWDSVAPGWGEYAARLEGRAGEVTEKMFDLVQLQPGERVLDLASGPGGAGFAASRRVGPTGHVVLSDVSPTMVSIAAERAETLGLENVSTLVLDLEDIDQPDGSYDVVVCREGLMLVPDPEAAVGEIRRVLRPAGRAVVSVWSDRRKNPWLGILMDSLSAQIGSPVPPPGVPGPFSLPDPAVLADLFHKAGLVDVNVVELPLPLKPPSFDAWWSWTTALAGPVAKILASMPEPAIQQLQERVRAAASGFETADGLDLPGSTLVATGKRPT